MQKFTADLIRRLTSRKFLLTLGTALVLYSNGQYTELTVLIAGYIGVEGAGDVAERYSKPKADTAKTELEATRLQILGADALPDTGVDKNIFVPGGSSGQ